jgi:hypothetical protein
MGDQVDDHFMAHQRSASPVLGDVGEHAVLNLVPLAGAWREMTDGDLQPRFVG